MLESERKRYNRDVHKIDRLMARRREVAVDERSTLTEELRRAYIAFDTKWNDFTPTEEQLARWLAIS